MTKETPEEIADAIINEYAFEAGQTIVLPTKICRQGLIMAARSAQVRGEELEDWALRVRPFLASDKQNDWSEELAELAEILGETEPEPLDDIAH